MNRPGFIHLNLAHLLNLSLVWIALFSSCNYAAPLPPALAFMGTDTFTPTQTPSHTVTFTPSPTASVTFIPTYTFTPTNIPLPTFTLTNTLPPTQPADSGNSGSGGSGGTGGSGGSSECLQMNYGYESQLVSLVNSQRAANGLGALSASGALTGNAEAWSIYMATNSVFAHSSSIVPGGGENIAAGYGSPAEVVDAWMNSEGHRANILNPSYTQAGAGYAFCSSSEFGSYWTLQFGP